MFWKKKKKTLPLPPVTERELEVVNTIIQSMTEHSEVWHVSSGYFTCHEMNEKDGKAISGSIINTIQFVSSGRWLTVNSTNIPLTEVSKQRLDKVTRELAQEKLLSALAKVEKQSTQEDLNDSHTP